MGGSVNRPNLLDRSFVYTPANATDVSRTWMRYGWKPVERPVAVAHVQQVVPVSLLKQLVIAKGAE
jgi:hypothetical protein